jgi:hypothetical protein
VVLLVLLLVLVLVLLLLLPKVRDVVWVQPEGRVRRCVLLAGCRAAEALLEDELRISRRLNLLQQAAVAAGVVPAGTGIRAVGRQRGPPQQHVRLLHQRSAHIPLTRRWHAAC